MIIAIDGNEANVAKRVGSNRFAFEVLWGMWREIKKRNQYSKRAIEIRVFLAAQPQKDFPRQTSWWRYEVFGPRFFWTWTGLVKRLYFGAPRPRVLFSPSHYGPGFSPIPFVISVMDLGFLHWPEQFTRKDFWQLKYWTWRSVKRARKVIAISQFTKKDIIKTYHLKPGKIIVAYPGWQKTNANQAVKPPLTLRKVKEKYGIRGDYILYLGTLKPGKNITGLIEAFRRLARKDVQLVITGKRGWLYQDIFQKVKALGLERRVIFTGFVADEEVRWLMKGAKVFALPSFWEGFGIPVLEAMAAKVPVLASDRGSLPEVVGEAGLLVNPNDVEAISWGLEKLLTDAKLRRQLIKAGYQRQKLFTWQRCSKIILDQLLKIAGEIK